MPPLRRCIDKSTAASLLDLINVVSAVQLVMGDPDLVQELNRVASGARPSMPVPASLRAVLEYLHPRKPKSFSNNRNTQGPNRNMEPCTACASSRKKCIIVSGSGEARLCRRCEARGEICIRPALASPFLSDLSSPSGTCNGGSAIVTDGQLNTITTSNYASGSSSNIVNEWHPNGYDSYDPLLLFHHPTLAITGQTSFQHQTQSVPDSYLSYYSPTPGSIGPRQL